MRAVRAHHPRLAIDAAIGNHAPIEEIDAENLSRCKIARQTNREPRLRKEPVVSFSWQRRAELAATGDASFINCVSHALDLSRRENNRQKLRRSIESAA